MERTHSEIAIAAIVSLWAAVNTVFAATQILNERRDSVLIGRIGQQPIGQTHQELILFDDWLPMAVGLGLGCLVLSVFLIFAASQLKGARPVLFYMVMLIALIPLIGTISFWIGGIAEYRLMSEVIHGAQIN